MQKRKVSFYTLGCKLNFSETSTIARRFREGGFVKAEVGETADICIVNTCSVTEHADKKCRNLIRRVVRNNPDAIVAVTGCYAQLRPETVSAIDGVDMVIGNDNKAELYDRVVSLAGKASNGAEIHSCSTEELSSFFAAFSAADRTRAYLKVQDGCSYKCSYCTVPYARGESRNIPIGQLVAEAEEIARGGQKEIVLTGVNTGDFGRTTGESFAGLLRALEKVEGIERYRISSIEPNLITDEIIGIAAAGGKIQPHFHIPLQSGSDRILSLMGRRYTTARFGERIEAIRRSIPDAFIGMDLITGFPGETDGDFRTTYNFLSAMHPAHIHIFPYSERPGTPAVDLPHKVPARVAAERAGLLNDLCQIMHGEFCAGHVGGRAHVLYESDCRKGMMSGYTGNYIKVRTPYDRKAVNTIKEVELVSILEDGALEAKF